MSNAVSKKSPLQNAFDRERVAYLAERCMDLRSEEILSNRKPEMIAKELGRLTTELTDLLISGDVSPKKRSEIKKKVNELSFEDSYASMKGNRHFNQSMVSLVEQVIVEKSVRKGIKEITNTVRGNAGISLPKPIGTTA